jgi:hypothetical protein
MWDLKSNILLMGGTCQAISAGLFVRNAGYGH